MRSILTSAPIALALFVSGCVEPTEVSKAPEVFRKVPVTEKFYFTQVAWNIGQNGIDVIFTVIEDPDGFLQVCGAYDVYGLDTRKYNYGIMRDFSLTVNGKIVLNDFTYFTKVASKPDFATAAAKCKSTSMPWPKGELDISLDNARSGRSYEI